jgi:uncharacterized OB-fold protein
MDNMKTHVIRKFQCPDHSYFDVLVKWDERYERQKCPKCQKKCESTFIATRAALPTATIVYEKPVGGKVERLYVDPQEPASIAFAEKQGFQRREIQGIAEARRFEREVANEMRREHAESQRAMSRKKEESLREAHAELRGMMSQMDDFSRALAREAIRQSESGYAQQYDPQFRMPVYSE